MDVCAACGIVAPRPGLPCEACAATDTRAAPAPKSAAFFVAARCRFQCRGCGRLAPLDAVELNGVARCALCGLVQAFDPGAWREALAFAHGVGDLAGGEGLNPDPRWSIGLRNPWADVGTGRASAQRVVSGTGKVDGVAVERTLRLDVSPGHPPCPSCREPLQVDVVGEGQLRSRCASCGAGARYDVPAGVIGACRGLRGIVTEAARADLQEARAVRDADVLALSCPGCGAPLRPTPGARTTECGFCHLVSRVPGESAVTGADRPPAVLWLLFGGSSAQRRALLQGDDKSTPIRPVGQEKLPFWRSFLASAVVAGGMTGAVGLVLFVLLRAGIVPLSAIVPP